MTGVTGVDGAGVVLLETGRMRLRRFTEGDADALTELDSDPEVMRYLTGGRPTPADVVRGELLPRLLAGYDRHPGLGRWAALDRATGAFLGWFALNPGALSGFDAPAGSEAGALPGPAAAAPPLTAQPVAAQPVAAQPTTAEAVAAQPVVATQAELGYRLRRAAWGRGLATEGSRALVRYAFTTLGLARVWAQTMAVNTASRRVMEKAGLRYVRTFHLDWDDPIEGTEHGEVEYELLHVGQVAVSGRRDTATCPT
ncbi:acetyltransferase [Micromonospora sp. ATCC 39149]|uniref:GNAT family N-acetyltransferase n=1 Tax=Micromonospora carbonacea TaxID=47853 RepID=A0A7D5YCH4_9ACTN|nr:GNAT family N-acetyltransferase [Micromonospora sp. ATCC 39149]EEP72032.1 acetyltransferase [Micromonospora sp. ATCC 39149]QLJ98237.1 GNAT family N-acetyltransferase [Micromonospora carbonacea]